MYNFIQDCLNGDALLTDIDDYIDQWHEGDSPDTLYEFLGMSRDEYSMWVSNPEILPFIIVAHKENKNLSAIPQQDFYSMAARSVGAERAGKLKDWLVRKGIWD